MKKLITLFLLAAFLFVACDNKTEKKTKEGSIEKEAVDGDSLRTVSIKRNIATETDLLTSLPIRHFPITDSTRFENLEKLGIPDNGLLKKINFDPRRKDATNFRLNYSIPFSKNFGALVVTYQCGENELFTTLITINNENKIIDKLDVAYDEVAESAFNKVSKIEKDKITITSSNWMEEEPIFDTETYIVESNGKFKKLQTEGMQK